MRKILSLLIVIFICITHVISCFAEEFENPPVIDAAELLTEDELVALSEKLEEIRQEFDFDVAIATEYELSGYDVVSSADDIYDYCGFGAGENDDGILFYICVGSREYHLTTHAKGLEVFNQNGIEYLKSNIQPYLAEDDFYGAMDTYADLAEELLIMEANGEPYNESQKSTGYVVGVIVGVLLIPLIIGFMMMGGKLSKMKTAVQNDCAANYIKHGSRKLHISRDLFLYSHITKTEKPKNNSGSHTSSSGRTHGGGGGSF